MNTPRRNGFDLDDTLIDFISAFLKFYNEEYRTNHEKREFHNYRFWEILGGTRERMIQIVHAFHETNFAKSVTAIDGAREMIQRLHNDWHENYIVTSRPEYTQNQTQAIVENIFGGHIKDIYFANHYAHHGAPKKKSEICAYLWLDNMTEDEVLELNIPTATPLVYELDKNLKPIKKYYLADENELKSKLEAVANQGKVKK